MSDDYTYRYDRTAGLAVNVSALDISLLRALLSGVTTRGPLYLAANNGLHKLLATSNSLQDRASRTSPRILQRGEKRYVWRVPFSITSRSDSPTPVHRRQVSEYLLEPSELEEHFDVYYVSGAAKRRNSPEGTGPLGTTRNISCHPHRSRVPEHCGAG